MAPPKKSAKHDPLDSVIIQNPNAVPEEEDDFGLPDTKAPVETAVSNKDTEPPPPIPKPSEVNVASSPATEAVPVYEVQALKRVFVRGVEVQFRPGRLVSEATHGPGIVKLLEDAGVPLKKVE